VSREGERSPGQGAGGAASGGAASPARRARRRTTLAVLALGALAVLGAAGCGGSGSSEPLFPTIAPAKTFQLHGFEPAAPVTPGKPFTLSFTITQPNGEPLTSYRRGGGPHTGVHLIIVDRGLSTIVHRHPPVAPNGHFTQRIVLPKPGVYRVVVDAYPNLSGPQRNFQLFDTIHVRGRVRATPLPPFRATDTVDGYRLSIQGTPHLQALQAGFLTVTVTTPQGRPARFTPWYGALAHAIFFRRGSLDYFHTHVCAPGASGCTSVLGGASVAGSSTTPGKLRVGVLVPVSGTWRLFLQCQVNGHVLTAPFTLRVS